MDCSNADVCGMLNGAPACPAQIECLTNVMFPRIIWALVLFIGLTSLGMVVFAGFKYITSQADKKTIDTANKMLFYAALGMFIVLFSFFILNFIGFVTGVTCLEPTNFFDPKVGLLNACR